MLRLGANLPGWGPADATLIDQRFIRRDAYQSDTGGRTPFQVWEYMVELPGPDGKPARLTIEEKSFELGHPGPQIGDTVPILVNRKRTSAIFRSFFTLCAKAWRSCPASALWSCCDSLLTVFVYEARRFFDLAIFFFSA